MDQPKANNIFDEKIALAKAQHFCAYQERSQQEVRDRLYAWGLHAAEVENLIVQLIQDNFLNEERFARAYATGKFRQLGWGKIRISQGLKLKKVSPPLIRKALEGIDEEEYRQMLSRILEKKAAVTGEHNAYRRRYKLQQYALSRGFESELINEHLEANDL